MGINIFKNTYLHLSLKLSVIVQIIAAIIQFFSMFMNVPPAYNILKQLLFLENIVQVVQGSFYAWLVYNIKNETNITSKRYMDWVITTPIMLITLICYIIFLRTTNQDKNVENMQNIHDTQDAQKPQDENQTLKQADMFNILRENSRVIITIVLLNAAMLLFGYLGETNVIPIVWAILIGFIPFIIYYYIIYDKFIKRDSYIIGNNKINNTTTTTDINDTILKIFLYFVFFWSLYGIIGFFPYYVKNTLYNIIDLFSKNFFGLLLSYLIFANSVKN
jgi:ABC-type transport system involved in cytochrome bd biosynthesis fused ATPase/permease subunit